MKGKTQTFRFKPVVTVAMLASVLLLGGCIRFGPQADEMEQTANQSAEPKTPDNGAQQSGTKDDQVSVSTETNADQADEERAESNNPDASTPKEKDSKTDLPKDQPEIVATVSRDDPQSMITIELELLPQDYSLVGMSWMPTAAEPTGPTDSSSLAEQSATASAENSAAEQQKTGGAASGSSAPPAAETSEGVTTTYHDAILAGQAGSPGFFIDRDGQRIGYRYTEQQRENTGILRLDFRDSNGGIVSWEERLTLGTVDSVVGEVKQ